MYLLIYPQCLSLSLSLSDTRFLRINSTIAFCVRFSSVSNLEAMSLFKSLIILLKIIKNTNPQYQFAFFGAKLDKFWNKSVGLINKMFGIKG